MRRSGKSSLAALLGLLVLLVALWLTVGRRNHGDSGVTLEFEMTRPQVGMAREMPAVEQRLAGISPKQVKQISDTRLTVWIPYAENLRQAEARRGAALEEFRKTELTPARLDALLHLSPAARAAEIGRLAPVGTPLREPLEALAAAFDKDAQAHQTAATSSAPVARAAALVARDAYFAALDACFRGALDSRGFQTLLKAADDPANAAAQTQRDELLAAYPAQATEILHVIEAHKSWRAAGGGTVIGPEDISNLLLSPGVLEFRIALTEISPADDRVASESLRVHGPGIPIRISAGDVKWFEIDAACRDNFAGPFVLGNWGGRAMVLCYDDHARTLTHNDPARNQWATSAAPPIRGPYICVPFKLDATGAQYMGDLTGANRQHPMAILVDDRALSAPTIQSQISDAGQITFGVPTATHPASAILREAQDLYQVLSQPPLPSPLRQVR